jgi:hypothetical protein
VTVVIPGKSSETIAPGSGAPLESTTMPRIVGSGWGVAPSTVEATADRESARRKRERYAMRIVENPFFEKRPQHRHHDGITTPRFVCDREGLQMFDDRKYCVEYAAILNRSTWGSY